MKDDYWSDILINVEEPLSSLVKKKDKGKMRSSKKQRCDDEMKQDEAEAKSQQDKAEAENGKANGGQASAAEEDASLTGLVLHFSKPGAVPSRGDLIKIFSQYGPVSEVRTETDKHSSSAQVLFRRRMDAGRRSGALARSPPSGPASPASASPTSRARRPPPPRSWGTTGRSRSE